MTVLRPLPRAPEDALMDVVAFFAKELRFNPSPFGIPTGTGKHLQALVLRLVTPGSLHEALLNQRDPLAQVHDVGRAFLADALGAEKAEQHLLRWPTVEITLNACFSAFFALAEPEWSARAIRHLAPAANPLPPLALVRANDDQADRFIVGHPECLLRGRGALVMIEMKVRGGILASTCCYGPEQHVKYSNLAGLEAVHAADAPLRTIMLVFHPQDDPSVFERASTWITSKVPGERRFSVAHDELSRAVKRAPWPRRLADPGTASRVAEQSRSMETFTASYEALAAEFERDPGAYGPSFRVGELLLQRLVRDSAPLGGGV